MGSSDIIGIDVNMLLRCTVGKGLPSSAILVCPQRWIETGANLPHALHSL
jgi:hypothetical protein